MSGDRRAEAPEPEKPPEAQIPALPIVRDTPSSPPPKDPAAPEDAGPGAGPKKGSAQDEAVREKLTLLFKQVTDTAKGARADQVDQEAFFDWAEAIQEAHMTWWQDVSRSPANAVRDLEAAIDHTLLAQANAPAGYELSLQGGLVVQWLRVLRQIKPMWFKVRPTTTLQIGRRVALEIVVPTGEAEDPTDREDLDTLGGLILEWATDPAMKPAELCQKIEAEALPLLARISVPIAGSVRTMMAEWEPPKKGAGVFARGGKRVKLTPGGPKGGPRPTLDDIPDRRREPPADRKPWYEDPERIAAVSKNVKTGVQVATVVLGVVGDILGLMQGRPPRGP